MYYEQTPHHSGLLPHVIYILNWHDTGSARVPTSFTLTVHWQLTLRQKFWIKCQRLSAVIID